MRNSKRLALGIAGLLILVLAGARGRTAPGRRPVRRPDTARTPEIAPTAVSVSRVPTTTRPRGSWEDYLAQFPATKERIELRDAYSRHYAEPDGSTSALISAAPIHYPTSEGAWEPIDLRVVPDGEEFVNRTNAVQSRYPKRLDRPVRIGKDRARSYSWTPLWIGYCDSEGRTLGRSGALAVAATANATEVRYDGVFPTASDCYRIEPSRVKHDLVLECRPALSGERAETFDYVGRMELDEGLEFAAPRTEFSTSDRIEVRDPDGAVAFALDVPRAEDGSATTLGSYLVRPLGGRVFEFRIRIPASWLLDPARQFPVRIDPTTTALEPTVTDCVYQEGYDYFQWYSFGPKGYVGTDYDYLNEYYSCAVEWGTSSIPDSAEIQSVKLRLFVDQSNYSEFDSDQVGAAVNELERRASSYGSSRSLKSWNESAEDRLYDTADGPLYLEWAPLTRGQGWTPWFSLSSKARSRLASQLNANWFGVGIGPAKDAEGDDNGVTIRMDRMILKVKYNTPPPLPALLSPSDGARVAGDTVYFGWSPSTDAQGDPLQYSLYCGIAGNPTTRLYQGTGTSYAWSAAVPGALYYWRVEVSDGRSTVKSVTRTFRQNTPPPVPVRLAPANGAAYQPTPLQVIWIGGGADAEGDTVRYEWRVSTQVKLGAPFESEGTTSSNHSPSFATVPKTTYYWSVRAWDGYEYSAWAPVGEFHTSAP